MNYTLDILNKNYEVVKQFCEEYRSNLTVLAGVLAEQCGLCDYDGYVEFVNSWTDDVFVGNYLTALMNPVAMNYYSQVINGEMTFVEFVEDSTCSKELTNTYLQKMGLREI